MPFDDFRLLKLKLFLEFRDHEVWVHLTPQTNDQIFLFPILSQGVISNLKTDQDTSVLIHKLDIYFYTSSLRVNSRQFLFEWNKHKTVHRMSFKSYNLFSEKATK